MFDSARFVNSEIFEMGIGSKRCILCGQPIIKGNNYLEDKAVFPAHENCVIERAGLGEPFVVREDSKVDPDHHDYGECLSLFAALSKIDVKNVSGKQLFITFEILLDGKMDEIMDELGIDINDFIPTQDKRYPKYQNAVLNSGLLCESRWFMEWLAWYGDDVYKTFEIGHTHARVVKILNKVVKDEKFTILSLQVEVERHDVDILVGAYYDLSSAVILKMRTSKVKKAQAELPFNNHEPGMTEDRKSDPDDHPDPDSTNEPDMQEMNRDLDSVDPEPEQEDEPSDEPTQEDQE